MGIPQRPLLWDIKWIWANSKLWIAATCRRFIMLRLVVAR